MRWMKALYFVQLNNFGCHSFSSSTIIFQFRFNVSSKYDSIKVYTRSRLMHVCMSASCQKLQLEAELMLFREFHSYYTV